MDIDQSTTGDLRAIDSYPVQSYREPMTSSHTAKPTQPRLTAIRREASLISAVGIVALLGLASLLGPVWGWQAAIQLLVQSSLLWLFVAFQTFRRLHLNKKDMGSALYASLGWGNRLTLLRSWLIAATGGFLFQPWPDGLWLSWLPGMIYFAAAMLDRVDGFVARRSGQMSLLGNELDTVSDALGLAVAALLAYGYGQTHWTYLAMGAAYYVFHLALWLRRARGFPVHPLPPAMHRRAWAGFQMGYLVVALWPLFTPPITVVAGFAFMLPALTGFLIDWLFVSGRIQSEVESTNTFFLRLTVISQHFLQPALRPAIALLLAISLISVGYPPIVIAGETWPSILALGGFGLAATMVLIGVASRYFCLLLVGLLGWFYISNPMQPVDYVLFCCVVWSMLLGSGRFSLWQEDDHWLNRYDGA